MVHFFFSTLSGSVPEAVQAQLRKQVLHAEPQHEQTWGLRPQIANCSGQQWAKVTVIPLRHSSCGDEKSFIHQCKNLNLLFKLS